MTLLDFDGNSTDITLVSDDPAWKLDGRIKSLQIDPFCHTIHLSLFNYYDWRFNPRKSAKLTYVKDNVKTTLTVFPKILLKTESLSRPDDPTKPHYTTFTLYARTRKR